MTDINVDQLAEAINDKMDRDGMNAVSGVDFIVETQLPTSSNNYTWYRLYKSGWVEQGGYKSGISGSVTITLPVTMADTNYTLLKTINDDYAGNSNGINWSSASAAKVSESQIKLNYTGGGTKQSWEVKGMAATTS